MKIKLEKAGDNQDTVQDTVILHLKNGLMGKAEGNLIIEKMEKIISQGTKKIIIDLSKVERINSFGLASLIACLATAQNNNAQLKLAESKKEIRQLLKKTQLIRTFDVYKTIQKAVNDFES